MSRAPHTCTAAAGARDRGATVGSVSVSNLAAMPVASGVLLVFAGLDTFATVFLNGQEVGSHRNMFTPLRIALGYPEMARGGLGSSSACSRRAQVAWMAVRVTEFFMPAMSSLSPEQRVQVVLALLRKEDSLESLARKAGVSSTSLSRWRDEFVEAGKSALGSGKVTQNLLARELESLRGEWSGRDQVIGELTVANRILKKTGGLS